MSRNVTLRSACTAPTALQTPRSSAKRNRPQIRLHTHLPLATQHEVGFIVQGPSDQGACARLFFLSLNKLDEPQPTVKAVLALLLRNGAMQEV
jgi:hypothetical protein